MRQGVIFEIKRLGAIRNSTLNLAPMMIFSGESGLGKSYAAFLIHYLYIVLLDTHRFARFFKDYQYNPPKGYDKPQKTDVPILQIPTADILEWLNKDAVSYIGYLIGDTHLEGEISIQLPLDTSTLDFYFTEELRGLDSQEEVYYKISLDDYVYSVISNEYQASTEPFVALIRAYLRGLVFGDMNSITNTFLLPPARGSLMEMDERPSMRSGMYEEFLDLKTLINSPMKSPAQLNPILLECCKRVNEGEVTRESGRYLYTMDNGQQMPLTAAASSIKELSPLTLLVNKYPTTGLSLLFEEPEAHIHPNRQIKLADLLACLVNDGGHLQVTTHSDYLIKRLNNLMSLFQLSKTMENRDFIQLLAEFGIARDCLLSPTDVRAYLLERHEDGTSRIVEQDLGEEHAIPFESFYAVIEGDINLTQRIDEEQQKLEK